MAVSAPLDAGSGEGDDDSELPDLAAQASADEVLRHRDVGEMTVAEREHLRRLFALLRPGHPDAPGAAAAAQPARAPSTPPAPCGERCATAAR